MDICIEHLPIRPLRPFVDSIWHSPATDDTGFEIVPDGCVDACFVLSERRPRILLFGTTTRTSLYELEAGAPYFGVRFRPGKASLFVRENIFDLTDTHLAVNEFLGMSADEVLAAGSFAPRRLRLESLLMATLAASGNQASDVVTHAVSKINFSHGDIKVRDLAATCNLSERQLERLFVERVGLTPKKYARIRRFRSVLHHLEDPGDQRRPKLAELATSYGYADQAHLMRDFRDFAHTLPVTA